MSYAVGSGSGHGLESPEISSDRFRVGATLSDFVTGNYSVTPVADAESTRLYNLYFRGFQLAPDFTDPELVAAVRASPGKTRYLSGGDVQTTADPPVSCVAVITAANYHRVLGGTIGGIPDTDTIGLATVSFLCDDLICVGRTVRRTVSKARGTGIRVHL